MRTSDQRFWLRVDKDGPIPPHAPDLGPCWLWQGSRNQQRYGLVSRNRVRWTVEGRTVPDGQQLDHLCRVRHCVNPAHLEAVSQVENVHRSTVTKLSANDVVAIRASDSSPADLAARFGVGVSNIYMILRGESWIAPPTLLRLQERG
jgi:hypothetical protein